MIDQQAGTSTGTVSVRSTGTRATRALGIVCLAGTALLVFLGLIGTPEDEVQRDTVRILYIHVPAAWVAYLAFGVTALCSVLYLWKRTRSLSGIASRAPQPRSVCSSPGSRWRPGCSGGTVVGRVLDVGRAPHDDGAAVRALPRLPGVAAHACGARGTSEAQCDRSGSSPSSTCRSSTSQSSGGARCTRTRRSPP